jgi:hypothetical protein
MFTGEIILFEHSLFRGCGRILLLPVVGGGRRNRSLERPGLRLVDFKFTLLVKL